jgi:hypothetical protein
MARKGRPRKQGPRHECGKLKAEPSGPTKEVLAKRRAILGNPDAKPHETRAAENPLDTMAARGWIDPSLARAGRAYADLYRRAGLFLSRVTAQLEEAPETANVDGRRVKDWSPEEIAQVWEVIERRKVVIAENGEDNGDAESMAKLRGLWIGMGHRVSAEVHSVCIAESWPLWTMQMVAGRQPEQISTKWMQKRAELVEGLTKIRSVLTPPKAQGQAQAERDHPFLGGPVIEEVVAYVDEDGQPDPIVNRAGAEVEVLRRRRA